MLHHNFSHLHTCIHKEEKKNLTFYSNERKKERNSFSIQISPCLYLNRRTITTRKLTRASPHHGHPQIHPQSVTALAARRRRAARPPRGAARERRGVRRNTPDSRKQKQRRKVQIVLQHWRTVSVHNSWSSPFVLFDVP